MGFIQSHSGPLVDIEGFVQIIPGTYKSEKPVNFIGLDKVHLKCDCFNGSFVNGHREPISYSLVVVNHQSVRYTKNLESNFLKR